MFSVTKRVVYSRKATKVLRRMPANTAANIQAKIHQYASNPASLANTVKTLQGETGILRLRVGDWRVVFTDDGIVVDVIRIGPRGSIYNWGREMNKQIITSPAGDRLVVLPEAEYDALVAAAEDASDIEAVMEYRRKLASGTEEQVPADVVKRLIDGENPVRVWRAHRGLTISQLAEQVGLSAPYLSEIETGRKDGTVATLKKIADALNVDLDDLVAS